MTNTASLVTPDLTGENTNALVYEQGITYDQAGITYDNVGIAYGGVYNTNEDVVPLVSLAETVIPELSGDANIIDDFSIPTMSLAKTVTPTIFGYSDMSSPFIPDPDKGMLIGPGLPWQFLTYP